MDLPLAAAATVAREQPPPGFASVEGPPPLATQPVFKPRHVDGSRLVVGSGQPEIAIVAHFVGPREVHQPLIGVTTGEFPEVRRISQVLRELELVIPAFVPAFPACWRCEWRALVVSAALHQRHLQKLACHAYRALMHAGEVLPKALPNAPRAILAVEGIDRREQ